MCDWRVVEESVMSYRIKLRTDAFDKAVRLAKLGSDYVLARAVRVNRSGL